MISRLRHPRRALSANRAARGSTLIEMIVAIGVASVVLSTAMTITHTLLNAERSVTKGVLYSANVTRLSRAFRADVAASERVEIAAADAEHGERLTLSTAAGPLAVYEVGKNSVSRVAHANDTEQREQFRFPEGYELRFEQEGTGTRVSCVLMLPSQSTQNRASNAKPNPGVKQGQTYRIEATPGRDARFASRK